MNIWVITVGGGERRRRGGGRADVLCVKAQVVTDRRRVDGGMDGGWHM